MTFFKTTLEISVLFALEVSQFGKGSYESTYTGSGTGTVFASTRSSDCLSILYGYADSSNSDIVTLTMFGDSGLPIRAEMSGLIGT